MRQLFDGWFGFGRDREVLCAAMRELGAGSMDARADVNPASPLRPAAEAFNAMALRIAQGVAAHKEFTAAVSHEFRHPLMRLRFRHTLVREASEADERSRNLDCMAEDLDVLDRLAEELLTYAQLEHPAAQVRIERFPVAPWLATLERQARELAAARGDELDLEFRVSAIELAAEPRYLARALGNLLANAIRYATRRVRVSVVSGEDGNRIDVDDDGPGVPAGSRERVFEPFWRGDAPRDRSATGFGVGLALVRRIARRHWGEASAGESPLGGARFTIRW